MAEEKQLVEISRALGRIEGRFDVVEARFDHMNTRLDYQDTQHAALVAKVQEIADRPGNRRRAVAKWAGAAGASVVAGLAVAVLKGCSGN